MVQYSVFLLKCLFISLFVCMCELVQLQKATDAYGSQRALRESVLTHLYLAEAGSLLLLLYCVPQAS